MLPLSDNLTSLTAVETGLDTFAVLDARVPKDREHWLRLWAVWPDREVWAHPSYLTLFARPSDRPLCLTLYGPTGCILFPMLLRPLAAEAWASLQDVRCDLVTPYGFGGPFCYGVPDTATFWAHFQQWAASVKAVSLFTRLSLFKDQILPLPSEAETRGSCIVIPVDQDVDAIWKGYEKSVRENIRQAQRAGVTMELDSTGRRLDEFQRVYYSTMDRRGALPRYYFSPSFFQGLVRQLAGQFIFVHAVYNDTVVSTELLLLSKDRIYSFLGGTLSAMFHLRPNHLLRHSVNMWSRDHGKKQVVIGGGYAGQDTLFRFKKRFTSNGDVPFSVWSQVFDAVSYPHLVTMRAEWETLHGLTWTPQPGFFPAYRS